jgi:hypothetical protein
MVSISRPHAGDAVGAQLSVSTTYQSSSPSEPIVKLELLIDSQVVATYPLSVPHEKGEHVFSYNLQSTTGKTSQVSVRAVDSTGGVGEAIINVTVRQIAASAAGGEDRTPPVVNVYYPAPGQHVTGTVDIKADVQDNVGVSWVFFFVDGKMRSMSNRAPYTLGWDTTHEADGDHVVQARASDAAENEGRSAEVHVIVGNRDMTTIQRTIPTTTAVTPMAAPSPKAEAPIIPAAGPTRERAALPVPAPVVRQAQPAAPPVVSSVNSGTARQATASGTRIAALPPTLSVTSERPGRPTRMAVGETVATTEGALAMSSAAPSWTRAAAVTAPRAQGVQLAYQISTPLGTVARAMAEAATMACAPVDARTAPSARPAVIAPMGAGQVRTAALPARAASPVETATPPLSAAELALAPRAPVVFVTAMMPPMPGTAHSSSAAPAAKQVVSLGAATEVVKGVRVGSLGKVLARSGGVLTWYPAEKRMRCVAHGVTVDLRLGEKQARVNGRAQTLEVAPFVRNGETMVPLSFLSDALGLTFTFDSTHGRLIISSKAK